MDGFDPQDVHHDDLLATPFPAASGDTRGLPATRGAGSEAVGFVLGP